MAFWGSLIVSFFLVAFGQPIWISGFGLLAGSVGIALFWRSLLTLPRSRDRFFLAVLWFGAIQGVQNSWMTSIKYMGPMVLLVYAFVLLWLGVQFGLLSLFLKPDKRITYTQCAAAAGCWVLLEWSRLFFLTGFPWNPLGFALADSPYSIQFASLFGVYGLSFWVILVNLSALKAFFEETKKAIAIWAILASIPYLYGWGYQTWSEKQENAGKTVSVALVQTGLLPEQKEFTRKYRESYIPPLDQWERIFGCLDQAKTVDLIVLPESALPLGAHRNPYSHKLLKSVWREWFGEEAVQDLPPISSRYGILVQEKGEIVWKMNNLYVAQAMANHFHAHVLIGLDDIDLPTDTKYNAAFHLHPQNIDFERYEKRVLVPVVEYIPFRNWTWVSQFILEQYGISDSFQSGIDAKIFQAPHPIGISICAEEVYSSLMRDLRLNGAELFVNLSNDVWFPQSPLPELHFQHGRLRAVENGVSIFRSCNSGVTGAIDCFGRVIDRLPISETEGKALYVSLPIRSSRTPYVFWGDNAILTISAAALLFSFVRRKKRLP